MVLEHRNEKVERRMDRDLKWDQERTKNWKTRPRTDMNFEKWDLKFTLLKRCPSETLVSNRDPKDTLRMSLAKHQTVVTRK